MDFQEQQKRKREEQLAADNQKRAAKRAALQEPPHNGAPRISPIPTAESQKIQVESTKYVPTIPDYALKIEFGEQEKVAPITAYNRFKLLNNPKSTDSLPNAAPTIPSEHGDEENLS